MESSEVLTVIGASGGLGASTLSAALVRRWTARAEVCVLVDGDLTGGGAEVTTAIEHREGVRWVDLRDVVGSVDGRRLIAALPGIEGGRVLSAGGRGPMLRSEVGVAACSDVFESLRGGGVPLVVDLPRWSPLRPRVLAATTHLLLLSGLSTRALADLDALVRELEDGWAASVGPPYRVGVVTRGRRIGSEVIDAIEGHLGISHLAHVADDRRVAAAAERGEWPGSLRDGLRATAEAILDRVGVRHTPSVRTGEVAS